MTTATARTQAERDARLALQALDKLADAGIDVCEGSRRIAIGPTSGFIRANRSGIYRLRALGVTYTGLQYEDLEDLVTRVAEQAHRDKVASDRKETTQTHPQIRREAP